VSFPVQTPHISARKRANGQFTVRRQSIRKRLTAKLKEVRMALLRRRHSRIREQGKWLRGVVQGFFNYHAVPLNSASLETFHKEVLRNWLFALRRRSERHRMNWERFGRIADYWIPKPRILHPYPNDRFYAKHPRQEPYAGKPHVRIRGGGGR